MKNLRDMLNQIKAMMKFHRVRGRHFSQSEMDKNRIRAIYNMVAVSDAMGPAQIESFAKGCVRPGSMEMAIAERSIIDHGKGNPLVACSVMVFKDREAFCEFAIREGVEQFHHDGEWDGPLLQIMN